MRMSRKRNKNKLPKSKDERIAELEKQLAQALAIIEKLQKEVEELKRAGKRQAAPFARRARAVYPSSQANDQADHRNEDRTIARVSGVWREGAGDPSA